MTVKYMSNVKLPKHIDCPSCRKKALLVSKLAEQTKYIHFDLLSYDCSCGESFTTTESDTASLKNYQSARNSYNRRELRKEKIIKCLDNLIKK